MLIQTNKYYTSQRILVKYFILLILIPFLLFSIVQTILFANNIRKEAIRTNKELVDQINLNMEKQIDKIKNFIYVVSSSDEFTDILQKSNAQTYSSDMMESYQSLSDLISNNTVDSLMIKSVVIINNQNKVMAFGDTRYIDYETVKNSIWYQPTLDANGKFCYFSNYAESEDGATPLSYHLIATKRLYDANTFTDNGVIYIEVFNDFFRLPAFSEGDRSILYAADENGQPLLSLMQDNAEQINQPVLNFNQQLAADKSKSSYKVGNSRYVAVISERNSHGWTVVKGIPFRELMGNLISVGLLGSMVLFICFIMFIILFLVVYKRITHPMQHLIGLINEIKTDPEAEIDLGKYPCYEAIQLNSDIITLLKENEKINLALEQTNFSKSKIELEKLQAEINPHFIYNTLTTIKYMAVQNNQTEISEAITALVKTLRSIVNRDGQFITVQEEFQNLNSYILIQQILNRNKIEFQIELDPNLEQCYMPNFLLQPLVENAILHGLNPKGCAGTISVTAKKDNDRMIFEITDDGVGIDMQALKNLHTTHTNSAGLSNIALPGIIKKIELLYQGAGTFEIAPIPTGGTKITIILPVNFK